MFNVFVNTRQLARQVNDKLYWAGAGDPARTEQIAMLMLKDGAFSTAIAKHTTSAASVDADIVDCVCTLLTSLRTHHGGKENSKGPMTSLAEEVRAVLSRAFISGNETARELNIKARRLGQRERTFAKNRVAVLAFLQDGNLAAFVKRVRKPRDGSVQNDPIITELWHDACTMKKGKGTAVRHWNGEKDEAGRQVYEEHQGRTQTFKTKEIYEAAVKCQKYTDWQWSKAPVMDADGTLYSRASTAPINTKATTNHIVLVLGFRERQEEEESWEVNATYARGSILLYDIWHMHVCVLILCFLIILYCNKSFLITHENSKQKFPIQMGYPRMTKFPSGSPCEALLFDYT